MRFLFFILISVNCVSGMGQDSLLRSGPMAGYHTATTATLWVQTSEAASVRFQYWLKDNPTQKLLSPEYKTKVGEAFTGHIILSELSPNAKYGYELMLNNQVVALPYPLSFFTKNTEEVFDFQVTTGSCAYIEDSTFEIDSKLLTFGGRYEIFNKMVDQQSDYMLWLGDNIYLRSGDWNSMEQIQYRYTHTRSFPGMQQLLATGHHFAIWDDHDFGPNDGDGSWTLKDSSLKAFHQFWPNPKPTGEKGIYAQYRIGDAAFFLLDVRYFRSPEDEADSEDKAYLGKAQMDWLMRSLKESNATFKLIVSGNQIFSDCNMGEGYCFQYSDEWQILMDRLAESGVPGILFLSGDKHYAEISRYDVPGLYPLYDLTFSPITSFPTPIKLKNTRRVRGTFFKQRNFGTLSFEGTGKNRHIRVSLYNFKGKKKWERIIWAKALR